MKTKTTTKTKMTNRRAFIATGLPALALAGIPATAAAKAAASAPAAQAQGEALRKRIYRPNNTQPPLPFSPEVSYGNLVFVSGKGAGPGGDIKAQTTRVLDQIEESLKAAGSSMDKVLKVNVYMADIRQFADMNEAYRPRFGSEPPVRTTLGGLDIPDGSLIEIECIGYI